MSDSQPAAQAEMQVLASSSSASQGTLVHRNTASAPSNNDDASNSRRARSNTRIETYQHVKKEVVKDVEDSKEAVVDAGLPLAIKLWYGMPQFSITSLTMLITIHGTLFYETIGARLSFIAFFTALARSFDVITDPLMGWVSDSTRTKPEAFVQGRRRPYIFYGCFFYGIFFVLLMSPPASFTDDSVAYWFGVFYVLFYAADTVTNVPYTALGPELTPSYDERSSVFFWQKLFGSLGTLTGAAGPGFMSLFVTDDRTIMTTFACIFGGYFIITQLSLVRNVSEREESVKSVDKPPPLVPSILRAFKNEAFRPLLVGMILDYVALAFLAAMFPFFVTYVVKPANASATLSACLAALFVSGLMSMPVWLWLTNRYGKFPVFLGYNLLNSLTNFFFGFIGEGMETELIMVSFLNGIPVGGQFLIESIMADTIDYDEFLNGTRSEGNFTVFATFVPKVVSIPAQALPLAIIYSVGFAPSVGGVAQPQPPIVLDFIRFIFVVLPCVCTFASYLVKRAYPIKDKETMEKIMDGIEVHMNGDPAYDPVSHQLVELLDLTDEETDQVYLLDNFSHRTLAKYHYEHDNDAQYLIKRMTGFVTAGVISLVLFVTITASTVGYLTQPSLAWIPSLAVMFAGLSLCFVVVNYMRLKGAKDLAGSNIKPELIQKVMEHKQKGQRGGERRVRTEEEILSEAIDRISAKYGMSATDLWKTVWDKEELDMEQIPTVSEQQDA